MILIVVFNYYFPKMHMYILGAVVALGNPKKQGCTFNLRRRGGYFCRGGGVKSGIEIWGIFSLDPT